VEQNLTKFVEEHTEAFCSLTQINIETAIRRFSKSLHKILMTKTPLPASILAAWELSFVAEAEPDRRKAIRLQREVIFLYLIERTGSEAFQEGLEQHILTLQWWLKLQMFFNWHLHKP
jgi:hypothetical protein